MTHAPGISTAEALVITSEVRRFCVTRGRACYGAFTPETLEDYIDFHMEHGTLAWVREGRAEPGGWRITGVAVAWRCDPEDLFDAARLNRHVFNWRPDDPGGRAIFIADVVATTPEAVSALLKRFAERFPRWHQTPIYTFRRGRVAFVTPVALARLWRRKIKQTSPPPAAWPQTTGGH